MEGWLNTQKCVIHHFSIQCQAISKRAPSDNHFQIVTLLFSPQILSLGCICWLISNKQNMAEIMGYHFWEKIIKKLWFLCWYTLSPIPFLLDHYPKAKPTAMLGGSSVERHIYGRTEDCKQPQELSLQMQPQPQPPAWLEPHTTLWATGTQLRRPEF